VQSDDTLTIQGIVLLGDHTYKILNVLEQTESHIADAEVGRRGYLLTGRTDYLVSNDNARSLHPANDIQQLKTLTDDGLSQRPTSRNCKSLFAEKCPLILKKLPAAQRFYRRLGQLR